MDARTAEAEPKRKSSRFTVFLVVCVLIAASFGGGYLWGFLRLRDAQTAWQQERTSLEAERAAQAERIAAAGLRELLWQLDGGVSTVIINLLEKNFGLARDGAATLKGLLARVSAELPEEARGRLSPLGPVLDDIERSAEALSPEARMAALRARDLLRQLIGEGQAPSQ
jgi:hypothetical protein